MSEIYNFANNSTISVIPKTVDKPEAASKRKVELAIVKLKNIIITNPE